MNKKGVTLVELLIYVTMFSVISLLIGSQMKSMTKSFSGGKAISVLQSGSRDALAMMTRDICNTGYKQYWSGSSVSKVAGAFLSSDLSSFEYSEGNPGDWLQIFKADKSGIPEQIEYYLDGTKLIRKQGNSTTAIAENVFALQFQYGVYKIDSVLVFSNSTTSGAWTESGVQLKDSASKAIKRSQSFNIKGEVCLRINYKMDFPNGFEDKLDSLRWEIRDGNNILGSETFKSDTSNEGLLIPVATNGTVSADLCLSYFMKPGGNTSLNELKCCTLWLDNRGVYNWTDAPEEGKKKYVKAIKVDALMRSQSKGETAIDDNINIGNISVKREGAYTWRNYSEIIEIPNNGLL